MSIGSGAAIFGCAGLTLSRDEVAFFREADPYGFIIFARNIETPDQVLRLTTALRDAVGRNAPVLIDQEGGRVQRMRGPHWQEWAPPLDSVRAAPDVATAARQMRLRSQVIAAELRGVGVDANCAPVADVASEITHPFLRNRCYGTDPAVVSTVARAVADGLLAGGVIPVVKHMPGHGRSHVDTHLDLPVVTATVEELAAVDFAPFRALADLPMAMTAHLVFSAYDAGLPATQSPRMIRVIREEIGFQGLLMTDDLNMEALAGTLAERTARSLAAGVDIALHCKGDLTEMQAVAGAAGAMTEEARLRGEAALAWRRAVDADIPALMAELADG
jgi:beta-N-acetylhexosaminidase